MEVKKGSILRLAAGKIIRVEHNIYVDVILNEGAIAHITAFANCGCCQHFDC